MIVYLPTEKQFLEEAHSLHKEALAMAMRAFGEMNVQTAKHYGNLGRLYQSMRLFEVWQFPEIEYVVWYDCAEK